MYYYLAQPGLTDISVRYPYFHLCNVQQQQMTFSGLCAMHLITNNVCSQSLTPPKLPRSLDYSICMAVTGPLCKAKMLFKLQSKCCLYKVRDTVDTLDGASP